MCYKVFNHFNIRRHKRFHTYYRSFSYEPGKCYYENSIYWNDSNVERGLHSYSSLEKIKRDYCPTWLTIVKCIIPQGAMYLKNNRSEYVSNYLIVGKVKDIIKLK